MSHKHAEQRSQPSRASADAATTYQQKQQLSAPHLKGVSPNALVCLMGEENAEGPPLVDANGGCWPSILICLTLGVMGPGLSVKNAVKNVKAEPPLSLL